MLQLTWFAAGALTLFLVIGGVQMLTAQHGKEAAKSAAAPATGAQPDSGKDKLEKLTPREFQALDRDRSGYLTPAEVKGNALLERDFARIDANHDGRVSLEEFTSFP